MTELTRLPSKDPNDSVSCNTSKAVIIKGQRSQPYAPVAYHRTRELVQNVAQAESLVTWYQCGLSQCTAAHGCVHVCRMWEKQSTS